MDRNAEIDRIDWELALLRARYASYGRAARIMKAVFTMRERSEAIQDRMRGLRGCMNCFVASLLAMTGRMILTA